MLFPLRETLFLAYSKAGSSSPFCECSLQGPFWKQSSLSPLSRQMDVALLVSLVSPCVFVVSDFIIIYLFVCVLGIMSPPR